MSDVLAEQLALLPEYLGSHLLLSIVALAVGVSVCLPTAILVTRVRSLQWPTLAFAGVMQTVPGIALLALMVPLLSRIGFLPAALALILYSMLPILRNTVTGIAGVDPAMIEAARGIGMTPSQRLFKVELPLAAPVIIAGIRTSTVWVVGTATLSTPVGATSLGNYIFSGLQTQNYTAVLVGCVAAAALAIVLDQLIRLIETGVERRSRTRLVVAGVALLAVLAGGLAPNLIKASAADSGEEVIVGAKTFTEQYILASLITDRLEEAGFAAQNRSSLGSLVLFDALSKGLIDCYVDYSGTIWANSMRRADNPGRDSVLTTMTQWLMVEHGIVCLGPLGFENTYVLALTRATAENLNLKTIDDLAPYASQMSIGSDYEFYARPEWQAMTSRYNLSFADKRSFDASLMYSAVADGQVDVISAFSTDGRIADFDLVVLDDPRQALPPYDAVLLLSADAAQSQTIVAALQPLIGTIGDDLMRWANKLVDVDGQSIDVTATRLRDTLELMVPYEDSVTFR